ncbi:acyltransferase [Nocardiopsis sp. MG754419]|uniref:acyltransferase n=1 Tax=Nocardiopsis sp. MG754419 TaxID=2259865 RepID=UPI001BA6D017|nr:acyltransferase family protein [Nocardiopsis sp. MG754419]
MEFARVAAMAAVIVVHAYSPFVSTTYTDIGGYDWWTAHVLDSGLRWCVAVFVMISGALLLRPRDEPVADFYRKRWAKIGVPLFVWTAAYLIWMQWRDGISLTEALTQAATGSPSIHLYFLYVIAGLYLFTPFLRTVVAHTSRNGLWWFAGVALAVGVVDQLLSLMDGVGGVTAVTRFVPFLGYYLLGRLLFTVEPGPRVTRFGLAAFILGVAGTIAGAAATTFVAGEWGAGGEYFYDFLSPPMILAGVGAYLSLRAAGLRLAAAEGPMALATERAVRWLSGLSFGVYLVHVMVLYTLRDLGGTPDGVIGVLVAAGYAVATAVISLVLVAIAQRIPLVRATV